MLHEQWGEFILTDDPNFVPEEETPAPRGDFPWGHGDSYWDNQFARTYREVAKATLDPAIPVPLYVPGAQEFLEALVLDDGFGAADAAVAFVEPDMRTATLSRGEVVDSRGSDGTLRVAWSRRFPRPRVRRWHDGPIALSAPSVDKAGFVEASIDKVEVRGYRGVMRTFEARRAKSLYGIRIPRVAIQWFEGPTLFLVEGYDEPDDLLLVAESVRPLTFS